MTADNLSGVCIYGQPDPLFVSNLGDAAPAGDIITYSDDVVFDALLVRGTDPVNLQSKQVLCLFNRQTRRAFVSDAEYFQQALTPNLVGVPGQSIEQVRQWVESHEFLPPLQPVEALEQGYPDYQSVVELGQRQGQSASYLSFNVFTGADGTVTHQTIDYRDPSSIRPQLAFTQTDAEGLQLIQTIYGEALKNDFVQASLLSRPDSCDAWDSAVNRYTSNLFTYQTWNESSSAQFTVLSLEYRGSLFVVK